MNGRIVVGIRRRLAIPAWYTASPSQSPGRVQGKTLDCV
jgi:hypothetical protein